MARPNLFDDDDENLRGLNTRVDKNTKRALRLAAVTGDTIQSIVSTALQRHLETFYPDAWKAVGDTDAENAVHMQYQAVRREREAQRGQQRDRTL